MRPVIHLFATMLTGAHSLCPADSISNWLVDCFSVDTGRCPSRAIIEDGLP